MEFKSRGTYFTALDAITKGQEALAPCAQGRVALAEEALGLVNMKISELQRKLQSTRNQVESAIKAEIELEKFNSVAKAKEEATELQRKARKLKTAWPGCAVFLITPIGWPIVAILIGVTLQTGAWAAMAWGLILWIGIALLIIRRIDYRVRSWNEEADIVLQNVKNDVAGLDRSRAYLIDARFQSQTAGVRRELGAWKAKLAKLTSVMGAGSR
jgi:hypothetical protein